MTRCICRASRSAAAAPLEAKNGGILLESAKNEQHKDNWSLGIKANAKGGQTFNKDAGGKVDPNTGKDTHTLGAGLKVGVEQQDKTTHANTGITAGDVALNSGKDTRLAGGASMPTAYRARWAAICTLKAAKTSRKA